MNASTEAVYLVRRPVPPCGWDELIRQAGDLAGWQTEMEVYAYLESLAECRLDRTPRGALAEPAGAMEGRVFAELAELRWVREADGHYRGWTVKEVAGTGAGGQAEGPFVREERDYFLIGRYDERTGLFSEDRYPGVTFEYPVARPREQGVRARIVVREYRREEPDWTKLGGEAAIDEAFGAELLVAHRFVRVEVR